MRANEIIQTLENVRKYKTTNTKYMADGVIKFLFDEISQRWIVSGSYGEVSWGICFDSYEANDKGTSVYLYIGGILIGVL